MNRIEVKESKSEMLKLCRYGYGNFRKQKTIIPSNNMILNTTVQIFRLLLIRKYVCRLVPINCNFLGLPSESANRVLSRICAFLVFFRPNFYSDILDLTRILRRYLDRLGCWDLWPWEYRLTIYRRAHFCKKTGNSVCASEGGEKKNILLFWKCIFQWACRIYCRIMLGPKTQPNIWNFGRVSFPSEALPNWRCDVTQISGEIRLEMCHSVLRSTRVVSPVLIAVGSSMQPIPPCSQKPTAACGVNTTQPALSQHWLAAPAHLGGSWWGEVANCRPGGSHR